MMRKEAFNLLKRMEGQPQPIVKRKKKQKLRKINGNKLTGSDVD